MKDSAREQNTIVAFYREYSRYCYLYFTIGKQWIKDLLNIKGVSLSFIPIITYYPYSSHSGMLTDRYLFITQQVFTLLFSYGKI